jgi:putative ABC transport system permease protein
MRTSRLVGHSTRALARYGLRSTFVMLGSLLGVSTLTLVVSIGQGVEAKLTRTLRQVLGSESIVVMSGGSRIAGTAREGGTRLRIDDLIAAANELGEISNWDPQQDVSSVVRYRDVTTTVRILGQSERGESVWQRRVIRGRYFDGSAVTSAARVAVIGETVARTLFGNDDPLDAEIRIGAVPFRIIGVLEPFGTDMHGMDRDNEVITPVSTLMRRLTNVDTINAAKLVVNHPGQEEAVARELTRLLRTRHALNTDEPDDFRVVTTVEMQETIARIQRILTLYVPMAAGVVLIVAGVVAATVMLSSINERVGEIGLRRAVGARPEDIRLQFATETAVTVIVGGLGGLALGYVGAEVAAAQMHLGQTFSWEAMLVGVTASTITGLFAGVLPARQAARLQPIDALR